MRTTNEIRADFKSRLDETTKRNLDAVILHRLNKNYDYMILIVGKVGDGKSQLAQLCCSYVDEQFSTEKIMFTAMDYRMMERKLKPKSALDFDEGEEIFYSRGAMSTQQKKMVLKFAQIRQKNHFIVLCAPSLGLLEKWLRGIGETRVNAIFKVERRGMFRAYGDRSGALQKIRYDSESNNFQYPDADFVGFWKRIPNKNRFWMDYEKRKNRFLSSNRESAKIQREREKVQKQLSDSLTIKDIMEIHQVGESTVRDWINKFNIFPDRSVFRDLGGHTRVKHKGYEKGIIKLRRIKERGELMEKYRKMAKPTKRARLKPKRRYKKSKSRKRKR